MKYSYNQNEDSNGDSNYENIQNEESEPQSKGIYSAEKEESKDFEPKCDTPRLHFKKPKEKKDKKSSLAGTKRRAINPSFSISIGKGGMIMQAAQKESNEPKELAKKEDEPKERKRDVKAIAKQTPIQTKPTTKNTSVKSDLSVHVVTRWYRSPEIILLERDYGPPIDIWSVG